MKELAKKINQIIVSEIVAILIFGFAYLIANHLPEDKISITIKSGIIILSVISVISLPIIIKYLK